MGRIILLLFIVSISIGAQASSPNLCDILNIPNCEGITKQFRRTSSQSLPSPATSANLNPATVSFDRGLGLEMIHQPGNPVNFNVASGTGKLGGALISSSLENGFFGNRVPELDQPYIDRNEDQKQYKSKKLTLALGHKLINKRSFGADMGIILKRHSEIKDVNFGVGLSMRFGPVNIGASAYKDDFILFEKDFNKSSPHLRGLFPFLYGRSESYQESFDVQTLTAGTRIKDFAFDVGFIKTKYEYYLEDANIRIYSAAYAYKNLLFNLAFRNENSNLPKFKDHTLVSQKNSNSTYGGVQVGLGKHVIIGLSYNYFLLKEVSFNGTIFF